MGVQLIHTATIEGLQAKVNQWFDEFGDRLASAQALGLAGPERPYKRQRNDGQP